jgi:hypothetical protein
MTFIVDGTNGLTFPDSSTQASAGKIIQVVNSTSSSSFSTSSSTYVSTSISASITPKYSTSKILVSFTSFNIIQNGNMVAAVTVYRGGTSLNSVGFSSTYGPTAITSSSTAAGTYLDSPATTSSTTYTLYLCNPNNTGTVTLNSSNGLVSIVLMEVTA